MESTLKLKSSVYIYESCPNSFHERAIVEMDNKEVVKDNNEIQLKYFVLNKP